MEKHYRTDVRSDSDYDELPQVVAFSIDEATAREIVRLSTLATANGLFKVQKFDYRASYYRSEPLEMAGAKSEDTDVRTDAECLNVSATEFWFSAYLRHCDVDVRSERMPISELIEFFDISTGAESSVDGQPAPQEAESPTIAAKRAEVDAFLRQIAALLIWSYDDNDGTPYQECQPPSDGFLDSHYCLMDLIEQARRLQQGQ